MQTRTVCLSIALVLCAGSLAPARPLSSIAGQETAPVLARAGTAIYYFSVGRNPDRDKIQTALRKLGEDAGVAFGPREVQDSSNAFLAVEVPADTKQALVKKAVSRGAKKVDALSFCYLVDPDRPKSRGFGVGGTGDSRSFVCGLSGAIRWFEACADGDCFFYVRGKTDARRIARLIENGFHYSGGDEVKLEPVVEHFSCKLAGPVDERMTKKALRELKRVRAVENARISDDGVLTFTVPFVDLEVGRGSVDPENERRSGAASAFPEPSFFPNEVIDALEKSGLEVTGRDDG